mmetsp:Transcript_16019/g.46072  ORF Transcript_16019/g.46072 Transcript_16019/m.46072 type:complete len:331 (-) Transcript_16019:140-1132(-)
MALPGEEEGPVDRSLTPFPPVREEVVSVCQEELRQEVVKVDIHLLVILAVILLPGEAEPGPNGLVDVQYPRRGNVPRLGVNHNLPPPIGGCQVERAILEEHPVHRGAPRSTVEPDDQGYPLSSVRRRGAELLSPLRLEQPVEQLLVGGVGTRREVSGVVTGSEIVRVEEGEGRHKVVGRFGEVVGGGVVPIEEPRRQLVAEGGAGGVGPAGDFCPFRNDTGAAVDGRQAPAALPELAPPDHLQEGPPALGDRRLPALAFALAGDESGENIIRIQTAVTDIAVRGESTESLRPFGGGGQSQQHQGGGGGGGQRGGCAARRRSCHSGHFLFS